MHRRLVLVLCGLAACGGGGGGEEGDPCGSTAECADGLECDPISHTCVRRGQSADAGAHPDAFELVDTTIGSTPPAVTSAATASFVFASNAAGATFECRVDGGAYTPCTSPINYQGLGEGAHTFEVRATVGAVTDATPASFTWTIDRTAPTPVVATPPNGATVCPAVAISLATSPPETGVTYQCGLDDGALATCAAPMVSYTGLAAGGHAVHIVATDAAGNPSAPLTVNIIVDDAPPAIDTKSFVTTPGAPNSGAATFTFSAADPNGLMSAQAGLTFGPSPFPDPADTSMCTCQTTSTTAATCTCTQLAAGRNFLAARAIDACGMTSTYALTDATATFGPYDGHAVVIGHDYTGAGTPPHLLQNAVTLAPFRHRALFGRPLRILGFTAGAPDTAGAKAALGSLIQAPNAYAELTDYTRFDTALPGRDVLIIYDQNRGPGDPFLTTVATTWNATLNSFLNAGGVVVLLDGTYVGPNGLGPTGTHEILSNATVPIISGLAATTFDDVSAMNPFRSGYPFQLPTFQPYWLVRNPSGGSPTYTYPQFIDGSVGFDNFFTFTANGAQVLNTGAAFAYVESFDRCGDGCIVEYPTVLDKVFPDARINVGIDLTPQGRTGTTGTGTFQISTAGVPRGGFTCFAHQFPDYPADPDVPTTKCTVTSTPTDTQAGAFSFDLPQLGYEGEWVAIITRLDTTDEPSTAGMVTWIVDNDAFVSISLQGNFPWNNARIANWSTVPVEWYSSVSCSLYYQLSAAPDPATCTPPCVLKATRVNAACGAAAVPGQNAWQQPAAGPGSINWDTNINESGFYRTTITVTDVFGNVSSSTSAGWQVSL